METLAHSVPYTPNQNLDSRVNGPYPTECLPTYDETEIPIRNQWGEAPSSVCASTQQWYGDPFVGTPRPHWTIAEVSVEGVPISGAGGGRRSGQHEEIPRSPLQQLNDALAPRDLFNDTGVLPELEPVANALRLGPLVDAHHSPYPRDLRSMPGPSTETVARCTKFTASGESRMVCNNLSPAGIAWQGDPTHTGGVAKHASV